MKEDTSNSRRGEGMEIITVTEREQITRFDEHLEGEHYLGASPRVGDFLRQVAVENGQWVALLVWGPAAYRLKDRDRWIGWDGTRRVERLKLVVQNRRFLVLGAHRRPNLASQVLGASVRVLTSHWKEHFGYEPVLAETFTDIEAFEGTCYKAAGWLPLGICKGHSRHRADYYVPNGRPKKLWVKPLTDSPKLVLCADRLEPEQKKGRTLAPSGQLPVDQKQLISMVECFRQIQDPRAKNVHFRLAPVLTILAMALLCGEQQLSEFARFANRLSQKQRSWIRLPRKKGKKFYEVPGYGVFYEVLRRLDREEFARILSQWIDSHRGTLPGALALDGKSVRDRVMIVTLADEEGAPAMMGVCPGKGHELLTGRKMIQQGSALDGCVITADALHCQRETARAIIEKGGDYVLQIKDNQSGLLKMVSSELQNASPLLHKLKKDTEE